MTQDELKQAVARAAADYVAQHAPEGSIIGVGTGSTANFFIDALASLKDRYKGAVASSEATRQRLEGHGIPVLDLNDVEDIPVYVDGADEIDAGLNMIKGGGGALTRAKIVAAVARTFVCICDAAKLSDLVVFGPVRWRDSPEINEAFLDVLRTVRCAHSSRGFWKSR